MSFKKILKYTGAILGIATLTVGIGGGIGYGLAVLTKDKTVRYSDEYYKSLESNLSDEEQVNFIANSLKTNTSIMKIEHRLKDNDGEPIYVSMHEDFYKPENAIYHDAVVEALDYMFGIVGKINPLYSYKIVEESELKKAYKNKVGIKYYFKDVEDEEWGNVYGTHHIEKTYRIINLDKERLDLDKQTDEEKKYTALHETYHAFGVIDTYDLRDNIPQTLIHNNANYGQKDLSFNDMKLLYAMYMPKEESFYKMQDNINEAKKEIEEYKTYFIDNVIIPKIDESIVGMDFTPSYPTGLKKIQYTYSQNTYKFTFEQNFYHFQMIDIDGQVKKDQVGKFSKMDNYIFIDDINLFNDTQLAICEDKNYHWKDKKYRFIRPTSVFENNQYSTINLEYELEKTSNQTSKNPFLKSLTTFEK